MLARVYCNHVTKCFLAPHHGRLHHAGGKWSLRSQSKVRTFEEYHKTNIYITASGTILKNINSTYFHVHGVVVIITDGKLKLKYVPPSKQRTMWLKKRDEDTSCFIFTISCGKNCDKNALLRVFCLGFLFCFALFFLTAHKKVGLKNYSAKPEYLIA